MTNKKFVLTLVSFLLLFILLDFCIERILYQGLNKYYGLDEKSVIALIGHSHLMLGVDKVTMETELGVGVSKYTREGVNVQDRKIMVQQLLGINKNIKTIIYGVDAWTFTSEGLSDNSYKLFYPFLDNTAVNRYIKDNTDFSEYWGKKIIRTSRYDELLVNSAFRGHLGKWTNLKFGTVDLNKLKKIVENEDYRKINNTASNIQNLRETLVLCSKKNIRVILLYVPTINVLTEIQKPSYDETIRIFEEFSQEFQNVEFVNFQKPWSKEYEIFYDPIHLNPSGQSIITEMLIEYLKQGDLD